MNFINTICSGFRFGRVVRRARLVALVPKVSDGELAGALSNDAKHRPRPRGLAFGVRGVWKQEQS